MKTIVDVWEPGDGSRYECAAILDGTTVLVAIVGFKTVRLAATGLLHVGYLADKLHCNRADALNIARWIGKVLEREVIG